MDLFRISAPSVISDGGGGARGRHLRDFFLQPDAPPRVPVGRERRHVGRRVHDLRPSGGLLATREDTGRNDDWHAGAEVISCNWSDDESRFG